MKELYHCESCGFLSTVRQEFTTIDGHYFCKECARSWKANEEPEATWVNEALINTPYGSCLTTSK